MILLTDNKASPCPKTNADGMSSIAIVPLEPLNFPDDLGSLDLSKHRKIAYETSEVTTRDDASKRAVIEAKLFQIRSTIARRQDNRNNCTAAETASQTHSTPEISESSSHSSQCSNSRDVLRQSLRAKEEEINQMIKKNSIIIGEGFQRRSLIQQLKAEIAENESHTKNLSDELATVRKELEFYKTQRDTKQKMERTPDKMTILEKELGERTEKICYFEYKLFAKEKELHELRRELEEKQRHVVKLEVEIETHDIKFASFEAQRRVLDKEALTDMFGIECGRETDLQSPKRLYIQKLLSEYDDLDKRYVQSRVDSSEQVAALEEELRSSKRKILSLERRLESQSESAVNGDLEAEIIPDHEFSSNTQGSKLANQHTAPVPRTSDKYLQKKVEFLEGKNLDLSMKIAELKEVLKNSQLEAEDMKNDARKEIRRLRLENDSLITKFAALEVEISLAANHIGEVERLSKYNHLEKKLDENLFEILRLEDLLSTKNRVIAYLRTQTVRERSSLRLEATSGNEFRIKSITKPPAVIETDNSSNSTSDETLSTYISELQSQLNQMQKKLIEKEEELRLVRSQSAARVAALRTRMNERDRSNETINEKDWYFF